MGFLKFKSCLGYTTLLTRKKRKQIHGDDYDDDEGHVRTEPAAAAAAKNSSIDHDHVINGNISSTACSDIIIRKFSWDEIDRFTLNLSSSRVIGTGGFSTVYLADHHRQLGLAAVKIINGSRLFKQELDILRHLHHHNIVNLIGYCDDRDDQGALVLEYVSNGSLQEKLHGDGNILLAWKNRMTIALQLAQTLEYLHDKCCGTTTTLPIVHGDIKASNVLLDQHLNVRLCDFGSAKMGFSSTLLLRNNQPLVLMGSPGYTDPHYLRTGIPSKKNDVYSFGVLLLELVTGMEAYSSERPAQAQLLTSLVGPHMLLSDDCIRLVDPHLGGDFDPEEARAMLYLSAQCLRHPPTVRPSAAQILETINNHISNNFLFSTPQKP